MNRASWKILLSIGVLIVVLGFVPSIAGLLSANSRETFLNIITVLMIVLFLAGLFLLLYSFVRSDAKNNSKQGVTGIIGRKVYTSSGEYVGVVKDIFFENNKIYGVNVQGKKKKGLVKSQNVTNFGEVLLVDSTIAKELE